MGYLLHRRVELSEERDSISMHHSLQPAYCTLLRCCWIPRGLPCWVHVVRLTFDYCTGRALETRNPYISYALWGVHDHASGQGAFDRIIEFQELPPDADVVNVQRYARVYIMQLIGGFLFVDKSNTLVHCMFLQFIFDFDQAGTYAWGAVTLAWLYRELCRANHAQSLEITGPLMLVQVWAYDRFPIIVPQRPLQHSDAPPSSSLSYSPSLTNVAPHLLLLLSTFLHPAAPPSKILMDDHRSSPLRSCEAHSRPSR
ncbi:serine/threonine-protein phosphatase 7 long form-like protein [Cucumis melo var. makuwa]|uniref:Serine/threonine-protein phosphatase 7 long form-like protein n=1 Tax=Cucumis melo var. makuwa TaxID=1194695 RepID=A0A5A7UGQ2_CUCMM|nr:serine/threonine-protein phosphatase 7 long form-like protein [Cucumis melo var. makuwa]